MREVPLNRELIQEEDSSSGADNDNNPNVYSNTWEYIMSTVGLCVGFGAFWRFPYLVYTNGGGVFLIPYTIAMILVGMPLLYLETALGQIHRKSIPFIFARIHPSLKVVGLAIMTAGFHVLVNCNILLTYSYSFLFTSFQSPLPFAD